MELTREELEVKAKELNINFNSQWKDETLIEKIEEAELEALEKETDPDAEEAELYTNTHNGAFVVCGVEIAKGEKVELSSEIIKSKSAQRAIELGLLVKA